VAGSENGESGAIEEQVWEQLRMVYDPEIPINIVDLGLIYECNLVPEEKGVRVEIKMTMTAPGCGMGDVLKVEAEDRVKSVPGVSNAHAEIVWDPPWDQSRMSDAARLELGFG
jgi:probable FeS assembly SUF system protein SufT